MCHDESIRESHQRSQEYGINKTHKYPKHQLSPAELEHQLKLHKNLLEISLPFLKQLYDSVKGSGFFINLTDSEGCILAIIGDDEIIKEAENLKMEKGAYMDESSIGTNSMGISIHEGKPVQITASEHFISAYHKWTCSAAPIIINEEVIACLNMTGFAHNVHPHSLGMVISAANAIENRLKEQSIRKKLETTNQFAFAMMNNLTFGVIAINIKDEIEWVNDTACRMINTRRMSLIQKDISDIISDWGRIRRIILNELLFIDEPANFNIPHISERFLFNAYVIRGEENTMHGFLITFRQFSRVVDLIKKYSGFHTKFNFDNMFAESSSMKKLKNDAIKVAKKQSTVLLSGESGTGKEVIAQSIHNASLCKDSPFIAINCGAISESLIESELFGYEDGAYTGAHKGGSPGKFELANHGTIFLDEIGDMPIDMQVKLLRTIQESSITRIGGKKEIKLELRIIAATNKDLEEEVKLGKFRLDLYYRLNVIHLQIPPLRERKDDILPMARYFSAQKAEKSGRPMLRIDSTFEELLIKYDWPGNVRELENIIERFIVMDGDYSFMMNKSKPNNTQNNFNNDIAVPNYENKTLEEIEKEAIQTCLKTYNNNISKTAKSLNISRNTLYLKLKQYNNA
jgi:transcriptional regulator with PAS, ATPase and Fis domain